MDDLAARVLAADPRALARAITRVEDGGTAAVELLRALYPRTGRGTVLGFTGSPGSGKSSLVDRLIAGYRAEGRRVGVVAVDPSSAYSGGAILGDRVRMQLHAADPGVFIRSMATRGHLGGLARATNDALDVLDAAGFDPLLVETVGVGQDEVDVVKVADVVAVVLVPGMGDDIQAIKAGIMEIADLYVINKADHPGADRLQAELEYVLSLGSAASRPRPRIQRTVAVRPAGVEELRHAIAEHLAAVPRAERAQRRRERARSRLLAVLGDALLERVRREALPEAALEQLADEVAERRTDPYSASERVLARLEIR